MSVGCPVRVYLAADLDGDVAPLVVCSVVADRLAARAQARHGHTDAKHEVVALAVGLAVEPALVVHQRLRARRWCGALDEVREADFDARACGVEPGLEVVQERRHRSHRQLAAMLVQHLDEAAHVRAFEVMRQRHRHVERRDRRLSLRATVEDDDRRAQIADPDLVDVDLAIVRLVLNVDHRSFSGSSGIIVFRVSIAAPRHREPERAETLERAFAAGEIGARLSSEQMVSKQVSETKNVLGRQIAAVV